MQGEPSVIAPSQQEESHSSLSVVFHTGEHRGEFPQQTRTAKVGFQTSPVKALANLPETASLTHTGCFCVQQELPHSQEYDLGAGLEGNGNQ